MEYESTTNLNLIRKARPCTEGWTKLLSHLGKVKEDEEPLSLSTILDSNGFDDALWVLSNAMPDDRLARHFQAWCAEQVLHLFEAEYPKDIRVREQITMLRNDKAGGTERTAARAAAEAAAWAAAWAATKDAAEAAAEAAWAAAWAATKDAAEAAAEAAWAAAKDAAWDAAWAAEAAAWDAAEDATKDAAEAAEAAAWDAAEAAARAAQEKQLRVMITK